MIDMDKARALVARLEEMNHPFTHVYEIKNSFIYVGMNLPLDNIASYAYVNDKVVIEYAHSSGLYVYQLVGPPARVGTALEDGEAGDTIGISLDRGAHAQANKFLASIFPQERFVSDVVFLKKAECPDHDAYESPISGWKPCTKCGKVENPSSP